MAHRFSKEDIDEQFEHFLRESLSDDSFGNEQKKKSSIPDTLGQATNKEMKKNSVPWWLSEDDSNDGIRGTSGSFLKSRRPSHAIVEVDEDHAGGIQLQQTHGVSGSLSKDSLETNDSVVASGPNENFLGAGLDTLEEQEEKEKFFADLEKEASSTIDYSKLNKELDSNDSEVLQAFLRNLSEVKLIEEGNEDEAKNHEKSGDYNEDFEEDSESNEENKVKHAVVSEVNEEKTGMLAKVVLLDSQDSILETQKASEQQGADVTDHPVAQETTADEMNGTGISCGQTNSDIEALHQAYCHIEQSLGDSDEQRIHAGKIEENLIKDVSQNTDGCPKHTSTTDSDLPTIEELMKPIRADSYFARDPASSVKATHNGTDELVSHLTLKEDQNDNSQKKQNIGGLSEQHSEQVTVSVQPVAEEDSEFRTYQTAGKEKLADKIKCNMLRKNNLPNSSVLHQDNKTNQIRHSSTWNKDGLTSVMNKQVMFKNAKNTVHRKKYLGGPHSSVRSSGYGKSSSPLKHIPTINEKTLKENIKKPALKAKSPPRQKETFSGTMTMQTTNNLVSTKRNYCATPGQSSASSLQQPTKESGSCIQTHNIASYLPSQNSGRELYLLKRVQEAEEKLAAAHDLIQNLKATCLQKEKELETKILEMKMQQDEDLFQLNQENYVLQTQLNNREDLNKGTKWSQVLERIPDDGEMLKEIQKEIENQETLLQGYQQENERLYKQVKELQLSNKKNEENMFKENQRLMSELASLREERDKNNILSCGAQIAESAGNQSFTDLLLELRAAKAVETNLLEERKRLRQDKQALEVDLVKVKKERDLARTQIASTSAEKSYEMKIMEESYKAEIGRLQKRLQWYAENQELLDKDAACLRGAKEEIDKLKLEVDKLRSEAGNQSAQQKKRLKDRAADAKRIQDLERQVKEMEGILKRRHPNSLPALIYAAATATGASAGDGDPSAKTNTVDFLERRVKKLEAELEGKDDEAKKSLRAMEQQFQKIKLQYEKRIGELEQLLAYKLLNEPQKLQDKAASLEAFEQELCSVKEAHQITVKNLQAEIDSLKNQIAQLELQKKTTEDGDLQSLEYQVEQAHTKARLVRLNQEMIAKNREIQDLTKTVERLQKERRIMLSDKDSSSKTVEKEKPPGILKKHIVKPSQMNPINEEFFPGTLDDKIYQPDTFADSHVSEVLQQNSQLKDEVEKLTLELSKEKLKSQAALTNSESLVRRAMEDSEEYIAALKASHQKELEKVLCQYAMEHSTSKVAGLNSKISAQEVLIKHLQQQVCELQGDQEALSVSRKREEILQKEMAKLLEELGEARESQTPEMKRFVCLERKIKQLEARYDQKEQEVQQVIQQTRYIAEVEQIQETEKWRKLALLKNQELEKFRIELDSMLDVLRQLQKQGVIIPAVGSNIPESYWKI
ncbi:centrosomal protein of 162 kDa [Rhineura floridana]|uniref:centrosomal protein of 162 kDa n=1 Tax=Rhineura floridana TaxID=261503 RepID=UPI002AC808A3|nr:centrosomal protein of 162 kDa [Rhineura floridana]XP_061479243.1 centrosomal protein of 162 kDa [Rhineura floridana]XP_061479244.1 centrosomal protein of 162 kDa [Rhineura floridana]XP_061479245.1 centrosomal protein of 162 kDa [Rhineura floridana]XP_061479246.1 centrosomal protein of 162 kDa [Rhineura floridana]